MFLRFISTIRSRNISQQAAKITPTVPAPLAKPVVFPNPLITRQTYSSPKTESISQTAWNDLPHITRRALPKSATDIRGIDNSGFQYLEKSKLYSAIPNLLRCKFFTVKFIPQDHHFCRLRKSNVAYTFTNYGGPLLNDTALQTAFKKYNGKFNRLEFFRSQPSPYGTAASRIQYRKLIKRTLHQTLHRLVKDDEEHVAQVSGVFYFKFQNMAITKEQISELTSEMEKAVLRIISDTQYRTQLAEVVRKQNRSSRISKMMRNASYTNTTRAEKAPGYYPKLPFS